MAITASYVNRWLGDKGGDLVHSRSILLTETSTGTTYTAAVSIPAGSLVLDVVVTPIALWTAETSASIKVGDSTDDDGFFTATNLKATDLVLGERLSAAHNWQWGGVNGAYLVSATGRFGAASGNGTSGYYAADDTISAIVTRVGTTNNAGRTLFTVTYAPLYGLTNNT